MAAAPPGDLSPVDEWTSPGKIEEFRGALGSKLDSVVFPSDDACLKRYLIARKGDVAEATKMILRSQQWRQDDCVPYGYPQKPVPLTAIEACLKTKAAYVHGVDKDQRPIVWVRGRFHDGNLPRDAVQKWIIHLLDELVTRCNSDGYGPSFTGVIDAADMGWSNLDKGALNFLLVMLSANYPERLGRLYILNDGFIFRMLWKLVEPFLDARTTKKISFLGGPDSHRPQLLELIGEENLPVEYGGKDTYAFDPAVDVERDYVMYQAGKGGFKMTKDGEGASSSAGAVAAPAAGAGAAP